MACYISATPGCGDGSIWASARSSWAMDGGSSSNEVPGKKARKPYTITKPRQRWSAEEHGRFLDALIMFGRDWKKIEEHVRTKTTIQIRSHAQKYFIKVQKMGLAAGLPPQHPTRRFVMQQQQEGSSAGSSAAATPVLLQGQPHHGAPLAMPGPSGGVGWESYQSSTWVPADTDPQSLGWPVTSAWMNTDAQRQIAPPASLRSDSQLIGSSSSETPAAGNAQDDIIQLPLSPDDLHFAQVYRFVGDMFDPNMPCTVEAHLQKLKDMDDVTVKTIVLVLRNLEANLSAPQFEPVRRLLSRCDPTRGLSGQL